MTPEPTVRQLRHFLSLAEHCHFSRAAEACLITQSSLSASIREMEIVLGAELFERTKRSVMLTPLGRDMIDVARDVLLRLDDLTDLVQSASGPLRGDLRLGVIPTIGPFLLPRALPGLRKAWPDLRLYLREDQTAPLLRQLGEGALDLVLLALPWKTGKFDSLAFAEDPLLAVFPRGHPLSEFETMTPTRLSRDAVLLLDEGNCLSDQTLAIGRFDTTAGLETATSLHTLVQMVDNGLGVTVLPKMAVDAGILRGLRLDVRPFSSRKATRRLAVVWRKSSRRAAEFRMIASYLGDELGTPARHR
jgi:LysR family hydrogen peroxide-inducible transcriptional activator